MTEQQAGRLAFRVEGELWVAYYALPDTMKDAIFLGSIRMAFVQEWQAKEIFMALMRDAVSSLLNDDLGMDVDWPEPQGRPAPQHERGGAGMTDRLAVTDRAKGASSARDLRDLRGGGGVTCLA